MVFEDQNFPEYKGFYFEPLKKPSLKNVRNPEVSAPLPSN
ncbi:MAG: hypothetical protein ACJAUP_001063 [Cellvibrionaceae bacterium]|jgi:hypothetical protein